MFRALICSSSGDTVYTPQQLVYFLCTKIHVEAISRNKLKANGASCWSCYTGSFCLSFIIVRTNRNSYNIRRLGAGQPQTSITDMLKPQSNTVFWKTEVGNLWCGSQSVVYRENCKALLKFDKMMEVFVWSLLLKLSKFLAGLFGEDFALLGCYMEKLVILL
jgi:hypothetical protein